MFVCFLQGRPCFKSMTVTWRNCFLARQISYFIEFLDKNRLHRLTCHFCGSRWSEQLMVYPRTNKQNQKKKRKVEPATSQVRLITLNQSFHLNFSFFFFFFIAYWLMCPGARPSQGSSDWLWYPWSGDSSRLEFNHLAGGTESERGWYGCCLAQGWPPSRISSIPCR